MAHERTRKPKTPLDEEGLNRLALFYVGRYATTRAKLRSYLQRKIRERDWAGRADPAIESLIERFCALGYIDDRAFASARAAALQRRGYGERRVGQALHAAGIDEADGAEAREQARNGAWEAALLYARRRRIGPYAEAIPDRAGREKAFAAMMRAGHSMDISRRILTARPGEVPESDSL